jgi:predicted SnoaL-like aldol condensation-catalyzing enzyme
LDARGPPKGAAVARRGKSAMAQMTNEETKAFLLEAFDTLFNSHDVEAAARFWSKDYVQHSAHIAPGREGLFDLVLAAPDTLHYENDLVLVDGEDAMMHGRFTGMGAPRAWIAADRLKIRDGLLAEHWDVIQDEATEEESVSKRPMFKDGFAIP